MEHGAIIVLGVILGVGSNGWRGFGFRAGRPEMPRLTQEVALMPGMSAADVGAGRGEVTVALAAEAGPSGWGFSSGGDEPRPLARPATGRRARHYRLPADVLLAMAVVVEGHPGSDRPRFAAIVKDRGRLWDLGCGPGQIVRYFTEHGVDAFGIDASASMVATARRLNPALQFRQGDFFHLPLADGKPAGVAAFYCRLHCARGELHRAVAGIHRVLMPGGRFHIAILAGEGEVGRDEAYGKHVALVATLFSKDEVCAALTTAGFRASRATLIPSNTPAGESTRRRPRPWGLQSSAPSAG